MKRIKSSVLAVGVIAMLGMSAQNAQAISIDINSNDVLPGFNGELRFDPNTDTFSFVPAAGSPYSFVVDAGPLVFGDIDGSFTIGAISSGPGGIQTASVSSAGGSLLITDPTGVLTGTVNFGDIYTLGTSGAINAGGSINLTGISYTGINPSLQELAGDPTGSISVQFGFNPAKSLTDLTSGSTVFITSFTGDLTNADVPRVPEGGTTLILMGAALSGMALMRKNRAA